MASLSAAHRFVTGAERFSCMIDGCSWNWTTTGKVDKLKISVCTGPLLLRGHLHFPRVGERAKNGHWKRNHLCHRGAPADVSVPQAT